MRQTRLAMCAGLAVAAAGALAPSGPTDAAPALRPEFAAVICRAQAPRPTHAWARGIAVIAPGSIVAVADPSISNEDHAELLFKLGLLQGHLVIGQELIDAKQPRLALPHFGHPVRELYDDIAEELKRRGVTGFDGELISLEALAAGKPDDPAFAAQFQKVIGIVGALRATVPSGLLDNEPFMLGVLTEVVTLASEEYSQSIESGRIEKLIEYHDSRGYLAYADTELTRLEGRPALKGSSNLALARAKLTEMRAIVGPLLPPEQPLRSVAQYKAVVAQFRQAAVPRA